MTRWKTTYLRGEAANHERSSSAEQSRKCWLAAHPAQQIGEFSWPPFPTNLERERELNAAVAKRYRFLLQEKV